MLRLMIWQSGEFVLDHAGLLVSVRDTACAAYCEL